jgi:thiamine biosynthesis lipoprotein
VARVKLAIEAMRTRFEIVVCGARDPAWLQGAAEAAAAEIESVEAELSIFRPGSALEQVNAEAAQRPCAVDGVVFEFLTRAGALSRTLAGAFDPTVGALLAVLRRPGGSHPGEIARAMAAVGWARRVRLDARALTVRFTRAGVCLDPGAIGKGWAIDRAVAVLRELGVQSALLHGGTSSVYGLGAPPGALGWRVAVQDPGEPAGRIAEVVLRDQALGVSAIHGRVLVREGRPEGHVLDPRTGLAVHHTALAAVVAASATDADAVSTALLVLGRAGMKAVAAKFPDAGLLTATPAPRGLRVDFLGAGFKRPEPVPVGRAVAPRAATPPRPSRRPSRLR